MTLKSPIVRAVYFPFTFIGPPVLESLSLCFDRVVLYRPVGSPLPEGCQTWVAGRFLEIRVPFEGVIDRKALVAQLQQWRTWGLQNPGVDTAYLKAAGSEMAPVNPQTHKIVSEIKKATATVGRTREENEHGHMAPQLFLHLAQDYDERSWELREHLHRFKSQQQALQAFFRIDKFEEDEIPVPGAPLANSNEDLGSFMIESRMRAWNRLFQKDHEASSLLFTDSPVAHSWLLEAACESIEVLKLGVPCASRQANHPPWKNPLEKLFGALLTTPWSEQLGRKVEQEAREVEEMIQTWERSMSPAGEKAACIRWSVVPGQAHCSLLNQRCGFDISSDRRGCSENTIVGLVEHRV
jgi:hypothetical protein